MEERYLSYSEERELIETGKEAAVAMARLWEVLHGIQVAHNLEYEGIPDMVGILAGICRRPPTLLDITDEQVVDAFNYITIDELGDSGAEPEARPRACRTRGGWASR